MVNGALVNSIISVISFEKLLFRIFLVQLGINVSQMNTIDIKIIIIQKTRFCQWKENAFSSSSRSTNSICTSPLGVAPLNGSEV